MLHVTLLKGCSQFVDSQFVYYFALQLLIASYKQFRRGEVAS